MSWLGVISYQSMAHAARFDLELRRVREALQDHGAPWRRRLLLRRPRAAAVLEGVEAGLRVPALMRACSLLYEDYVSVRMACNSLLRLLARLMRET